MKVTNKVLIYKNFTLIEPQLVMTFSNGRGGRADGLTEMKRNYLLNFFLLIHV